MRFSRKQLCLAMASLALLGGSGCSSMHHSYSVSPLTFLIPGLVQTGNLPDPTDSGESSLGEIIQTASVR
jgi:hypothetical protein